MERVNKLLHYLSLLIETNKSQGNPEMERIINNNILKVCTEVRKKLNVE